MWIDRYALAECYNCVLQLARCHEPPTSIVPSPRVIAVTLVCNFQAAVKVGFHEAPLTWSVIWGLAPGNKHEIF